VYEEKRKRLREFEERETSRQSCRGDCELQEGKLLRHLSGFRPRIWPQARRINECIYKGVSKAQFFFHCIFFNKVVQQ
jgi:hypothetical protein